MKIAPKNRKRRGTDNQETEPDGQRHDESPPSESASGSPGTKARTGETPSSSAVTEEQSDCCVQPLVGTAKDAVETAESNEIEAGKTPL